MKRELGGQHSAYPLQVVNRRVVDSYMTLKMMAIPLDYSVRVFFHIFDQRYG